MNFLTRDEYLEHLKKETRNGKLILVEVDDFDELDLDSSSYFS